LLLTINKNNIPDKMHTAFDITNNKLTLIKLSKVRIKLNEYKKRKLINIVTLIMINSLIDLN